MMVEAIVVENRKETILWLLDEFSTTVRNFLSIPSILLQNLTENMNPDPPCIMHSYTGEGVGVLMH